MKRLRGFLLVAFIFGCGFVAGGFLGAAFGWMGLYHKIVKGGPEAVRQIVLDRAIHDWKLDPEQRREVRKIVEETSAELDAATASVRPQVREILGRGEERIRPLLNEQQRKKFDDLLNTGRRRWKPAPPAPEAPAALP